MEKAQPKSVLDKEEERARRRRALAEAAAVEEAAASSAYTYFKPEDVALLKRPLVIHPIPLLSVTDHYFRSAASTNRRVVGCLLGEVLEGTLHVTNSFGVPFEENMKDLSVWFVDHNYLNKMYKMFKKINARESIVGWYSSAESIRENDTDIHEFFRKYHPHPVLLTVNLQQAKYSIMQTYYSFEQPSCSQRRVFLHTPHSLGTSEAEKVGVEHLLRDRHACLETTLGINLANKAEVLRTAAAQLSKIALYLRKVADGSIPEQSHIINHLQNLLNALPDKSDPQILAQGFQKYTNDALFSCYIGFAARAVMAIHDLTLNKKQLKEAAP